MPLQRDRSPSRKCINSDHEFHREPSSYSAKIDNKPIERFRYIDYNCISDKELYDRARYIGYSENARVIEKTWKVVLNAEG